MHIFADPEQGMQIAKPPLPFLHIGLDDIAAVAHPFMPLLSLGQFLGDEDACCILDHFLVEAARHLPVNRLIAPDISSFEQGRADSEILPGHAHGFGSEEHTSELQSLMRISYAVFCLKKNNITQINTTIIIT